MENNNDLINSEVNVKNEESYVKPLTANESFNNALNLNANNPPIENKNGISIINNNLDNVKKEDKEKNKEQDEPHNISRISVKTQYKTQVPFVTIKIIFPAFIMYKYLIYGIKNKEDQNYCKYAICLYFFYVLFCYYLTVLTKNSQTNVNKYFSESALTFKEGSPGNEIIDISIYQWDNCLFCKSKKFGRSSHCRICNKCVLMRDHHCPYIANCVGFKNMQYFFNFIVGMNVGNFMYIYMFIYYMFFSGIKKKIPFYIYILMYADLLINILFIMNITGILIRLLVTAYNNWTQKENLSDVPVEHYCPITSCCIKKEKITGVKREINFYNIGFLSHFYYLIGPTILHFIFPLPKYKNYTLDENCPVFKEISPTSRLDTTRFKNKKDPNNLEFLYGESTSPESYLEFCHQYYDGKKIV